MQRQDFKKTDDMFNRVLGKDHIAVVCLMENLHTGTRFIIANAHIHWDPAYRDVKLVQVALLLEEIEKIANGFAKYPPPKPATDGESLTSSEFSPSTPPPHTDESEGPNLDAVSIAVDGSEPTTDADSQPLPNSTRPPPIYTDGTKIPLIICGDFNSGPDSGVCEFLSTGSLPPDHPDFMSHMYGRYTSEGIRHRLGLKNAYAAPGAGELPLTNYTPSFQGVIDYVWYSAANLTVTSVLGEVNRGYLEKVVGFPNAHFPSECVSSFFFFFFLFLQVVPLLSLLSDFTTIKMLTSGYTATFVSWPNSALNLHETLDQRLQPFSTIDHR
jgi:CCR4-NOT transcription complex subunit 6